MRSPLHCVGGRESRGSATELNSRHDTARKHPTMIFTNCVGSDAIKTSSSTTFLNAIKSWQAKFQKLFSLPSTRGLGSQGAFSFISKQTNESDSKKATDPKKATDQVKNELLTKLSIETDFENLLEFSTEENDSSVSREKVKTSIIMPNYSIKDVHSILANSTSEAHASPSYTFQRLSACSFKQDGVKYCRLPDNADLSYLSGWEVHVQEFGIGIVQKVEILSDNGDAITPPSRDDVLSMFLTVTFQCNVTHRVRLQLVDHAAAPEHSYSYNNAPKPKLNVTFLQKLFWAPI